jgi:hypothetical protein
MDMHFNMGVAPEQWKGIGNDVLAERPLVWAELAPRLAAAHAFQRSMAQSGVDWMTPMGSFDPVAAQSLMDFAASPASDWCVAFPPRFSGLDKGYPAINPVVSGDGKLVSGREYGVAGAPKPAFEG